MWQRFSERARKSVFYAQEEAQKGGEGSVSTEHLLLGLLRETDSVAAQVLIRLGVNLKLLQDHVRSQIPEKPSSVSQDMTLTPRAKRIIDLAYDEARGLVHEYIGTEHLLLGLVRENEGIAGRSLAKFDITLERCREQVRDLTQSKTSDKADLNPPAPKTEVAESEFLRAALAAASVNATKTGNANFGTDDLLKAFLDAPQCEAHMILVRAGVDLDSLRQSLSDRPSFGPSAGEQATQSVSVWRVLKEAAGLAIRVDGASTGSALVAMLDCYGSTAYRILSSHLDFETAWRLAKVVDLEP